MTEKELGPEFVIMGKIRDLLVKEDCDVKHSIVAMGKLVCGFFALAPEGERHFKEFIEDTEAYFEFVLETTKGLFKEEEKS